MENDYEYDDNYEDDNNGREWRVRLAAAGAGVAVIAVLWFALQSNSGGDDVASERLATGNTQVEPAATGGSTDTAAPADSDDGTVDDETSAGDDATVDEGTSVGDDGTVDDGTSVGDDETVDEGSVGDDEAAGDDGTADDETVGEGSSVGDDEAPPDTADPSATTPGAESAPQPVTYDTLPDGRPVPILGIYDGALITLSGSVPTEAAAQRLQVLAVASSSVPDAEIASFLTIDPTVPANIAVRVLEMNAARFPEGTPTILPEHAVTFDRVSAIMTALPNITVEVVGHADQRGDDVTNFALSADRARAVLDYLVGSGIDPGRLTSRGAGETDLLTLNNDDLALALNRRTEFIFTGLLLEPTEAG